MAGSIIPIKTLAAMRYGCQPEELIKFREAPAEGVVVIIAPTGQKFKYSIAELAQLERLHAPVEQPATDKAPEPPPDRENTTDTLQRDIPKKSKRSKAK